MLHVITILVQLSIEVSGSGYFIKFATKFLAERFFSHDMRSSSQWR